jgi:hypothetical protein
MHDRSRFEPITDAGGSPQPREPSAAFGRGAVGLRGAVDDEDRGRRRRRERRRAVDERGWAVARRRVLEPRRQVGGVVACARDDRPSLDLGIEDSPCADLVGLGDVLPRPLLGLGDSLRGERVGLGQAGIGRALSLPEQRLGAAGLRRGRDLIPPVRGPRRGSLGGPLLANAVGVLVGLDQQRRGRVEGLLDPLFRLHVRQGEPLGDLALGHRDAATCLVLDLLRHLDLQERRLLQGRVEDALGLRFGLRRLGRRVALVLTLDVHAAASFARVGRRKRIAGRSSGSLRTVLAAARVEWSTGALTASR